jgi:uncharacterized protein (DUF1778 family)
MKRSMVQLSKTQIGLFLEIIDNAASTENLIFSKLTSAQQHSADPTSIELSEDELEKLLDVLPMPTQSNETVVKLRQSLYAALSELRSS